MFQVACNTDAQHPLTSSRCDRSPAPPSGWLLVRGKCCTIPLPQRLMVVMVAAAACGKCAPPPPPPPPLPSSTPAMFLQGARIVSHSLSRGVSEALLEVCCHWEKARRSMRYSLRATACSAGRPGALGSRVVRGGSSRRPRGSGCVCDAIKRAMWHQCHAKGHMGNRCPMHAVVVADKQPDKQRSRLVLVSFIMSCHGHLIMPCYCHLIMPCHCHCLDSTP